MGLWHSQKHKGLVMVDDSRADLERALNAFAEAKQDLGL
jgi:hypothetical protein